MEIGKGYWRKEENRREGGNKSVEVRGWKRKEKEREKYEGREEESMKRNEEQLGRKRMKM